jgi:hypothetical protein
MTDVVYFDFRDSGSDSDIFMYDLNEGEEKVLINLTVEQVYPRVYKNFILW